MIVNRINHIKFSILKSHSSNMSMDNGSSSTPPPPPPIICCMHMQHMFDRHDNTVLRMVRLFPLPESEILVFMNDSIPVKSLVLDYILYHYYMDRGNNIIYPIHVGFRVLKPTHPKVLGVLCENALPLAIQCQEQDILDNGQTYIRFWMASGHHKRWQVNPDIEVKKSIPPPTTEILMIMEAVRSRTIGNSCISCSIATFANICEDWKESLLDSLFVSYNNTNIDDKPDTNARNQPLQFIQMGDKDGMVVLKKEYDLYQTFVHLVHERNQQNLLSTTTTTTTLMNPNPPRVAYFNHRRPPLADFKNVIVIDYAERMLVKDAIKLLMDATDDPRPIVFFGCNRARNPDGLTVSMVDWPNTTTTIPSLSLYSTLLTTDITSTTTTATAYNPTTPQLIYLDDVPKYHKVDANVTSDPGHSFIKPTQKQYVYTLRRERFYKVICFHVSIDTTLHHLAFAEAHALDF
jgi:hypothetical protein